MIIQNLGDTRIHLGYSIQLFHLVNCPNQSWREGRSFSDNSYMSLKVILIVDGEIIAESETRSDVSNALGYLYQVDLNVKNYKK